LLYGDAARDLNIKQVRRRTKPTIVESTNPTIEPSNTNISSLLSTKKAMDLDAFLKQNKILYNDKLEIILNGNVVPNTNYPMVVKAIQNHQVGLQPGMVEVLRALPSIPDGLYSKPVIAKYMPALMPTPSISATRRVKRVKKAPVKRVADTSWITV